MRLLHPDEMAHLPEDQQQELIAEQRRDMNLKPWELCLLEVDDGPSPWPAGTAGHTAWYAAQRLRAKLRNEKRPPCDASAAADV
jgi:hypothetical protein